MKTMISCDVHDYFEIVCMRKSHITITLHSDEKVSGEASDIVLNQEKQECLLMMIHDVLHAILLAEIKHLHAHNNPTSAHNFQVKIA
jgi:Rho-binding antiterminator